MRSDNSRAVFLSFFLNMIHEDVENKSFWLLRSNLYVTDIPTATTPKGLALKIDRQFAKGTFSHQASHFGIVI